jgi:hypothetical protein
MTTVAISALPAVASSLAADVFPVVQNGVTSQITNANLFGSVPNLTVTGSLSVPNLTVTGSTSTPNTFGFKNRIINGAFNVGQYSFTSTSGASTVTSAYVTDRWIAQAISSGTGVGFSAAVAAATLPSGGTQNALTVTQTQTLGTSISILQRIEARHLTDLYNSTVTVSYYVSTSASANISYAIYYAGTTADTWQAVGLGANVTTGSTLITVNGGISTTTSLALKTITFSLGTTAPTRGIEIIITTSATNGQSMTITGMQLEKGGAATSFDYRPYTTELTLASRYFGQYGTVVGTSTFTNPIVPRTAMRVTPTVSAVSVPSGTGAAYSFSTYGAATGFGVAYQSTAHSATSQAVFTLNSEL